MDHTIVANFDVEDQCNLKFAISRRRYIIVQDTEVRFSKHIPS